MGGGALEPKTVVGVSKKAFYKKKKKAFTLAEVLITLAIIGVVAALTIPVVVAKYQQKAYYTNFMKTYNTLSTALSMAVMENGTIDTWGGGGDISEQEIFDSHIAPYLKISKTCNEGECNFDNLKVSPLNFDMSLPYSDVFFYDGIAPIILNDGSIISFDGIDESNDIMIDTNGTKGPNIVGRDIFMLSYMLIDNNYKLIAPESYTVDSTSRHKISPSYDEAMEKLLGDDDAYKNCTFEHTSYGFACAGRLLLEGKMDY